MICWSMISLLGKSERKLHKLQKMCGRRIHGGCNEHNDKLTVNFSENIKETGSTTREVYCKSKWTQS